jgi:diguanylate cyclase (GGDEF)-like protein
MDEDRAPTAAAEQDDRDLLARIGDDRDRSAADRDERADAHDLVSEARDERGKARDKRAEAREEAAESFDALAASDRAAANRDRRGAASDRVQAADDREAAAGDRVVSARERAVSSIDELTGAYRRDAGTLELERDILRAKRTGRPFVVAFVDVDNLKARNDSLGHAAGDQLLHRTVDSMRRLLRSYDLIIRYGGDEFVCALLDVSMAEAAKRFEAINEDLGKTDHGSITVGLAEMGPEETIPDLIARADQALYEQREQRRSP